MYSGSCYHRSCANHRFCAAGFCSFLFRQRCLAFPCSRYRAGTARRQGRRWVASLNVWLTSFSALFFLCFTLAISFWVGSALRFALIGMSCGGILGLLGLAITRWEKRSEGLFYTPSRWLALLVILVIAARFAYGWWRATHSGNSRSGDQYWLVTASERSFLWQSQPD